MSQRKNNQPKGIIVSFLSSILGILIAAILYNIKWDFLRSTERTLSLWLLVLVTCLMFRFYLKVLFIDSQIDNINPKILRWGLIFIVVLSAMTGVIWPVFDFGEINGAIFMTAYAFLFFIFSVLTLKGLLSSTRQAPENLIVESWLPPLTDIAITIFWGYYSWYLYSGSKGDVDDGLMLTFFFLSIMLTYEFTKLFAAPFFERLNEALDVFS